MRRKKVIQGPSFSRDLRNLLSKYYLGPSVVVFVSILLIVLVLYGYSFFYTAQQESRSASQDLEEIVSAYMAGLSSISIDENLAHVVLTGKGSSSMARVLYDFVNSQVVGAEFFVIDTMGNIKIGSSTVLADYLRVKPPYYSGFLYRLEQNPTNPVMMLSSLGSARANTMVLSLGQPILEDGKLLGYLVFELSPNELLRTIFQGGVGELIVTNTFHTALLSSNNLFLDKYSKLLSMYRKENSGYVRVNGNRFFIAREYNRTLDLYLYVLVEISTIGKVIIVTILILFGIILGSMGVLLLATTHIIKAETRSIDILFANIKKMQAEGLYTSIDSMEGGFKSLQTTYALLIEHIRELVEANKAETELRRSAEIRQLESQFNPHFIFNTLEAIRCSMKEDVGAANKMILAFAEILRYSISSNKQMVPLVDDLHYVDSYLALHQMSVNNLRYSIDVDDEAKDIEIPKLCIQPLIENAVKYGKRGGNLCVEVSAKIMGGSLHISVSDSGPGIPKKRLEEIKKTLNDEKDTVRFFGLNNVHRRLVLQYGQEAGLKIESGSTGTRVSFLIPHYLLFSLSEEVSHD